ncbi:unnamed protein product, partial [Symbiodinium necroappetens]
ESILADLQDSDELEGPLEDHGAEEGEDLGAQPGQGAPSSQTACDPCLLFFSRRGCTKGSACHYCHLDHPHFQRAARRPRRQARERYKRSVLQLLHSQLDLEQIHDELQ